MLPGGEIFSTASRASPASDTAPGHFFLAKILTTGSRCDLGSSLLRDTLFSSDAVLDVFKTLGTFR
jgi:hypothetical protein